MPYATSFFPSALPTSGVKSRSIACTTQPCGSSSGDPPRPPQMRKPKMGYTIPEYSAAKSRYDLNLNRSLKTVPGIAIEVMQKVSDPKKFEMYTSGAALKCHGTHDA